MWDYQIAEKPSIALSIASALSGGQVCVEIAPRWYFLEQCFEEMGFALILAC